MPDLPSRSLSAAGRDAAATIHDVSLTIAKIRNVLAVIGADERLQAEVAARSYQHANGFQKLVISATSSREQLRIHVWEPLAAGALREHGNIHNHRWAFTSAVLAGTLYFQEFVYSNCGEESDFYSYIPQDTTYGLVRGTARRIAQRDAGARRAGTFYTLTEETLHRTWASAAERTITVVAQKPSTRACADVLTPIGKPIEPEHKIHALEIGELRQVLKRILQTLPS